MVVDHVREGSEPHPRLNEPTRFSLRRAFWPKSFVHGLKAFQLFIIKFFQIEQQVPRMLIAPDQLI